jgi:RNA polymerase sigma factor (sigma-70 family)
MIGWKNLGQRISRSFPPERLQSVSMKPFERVVTEHGATVLRVCRAVVGPVDADDAWSETFLAALRAYPALPADANVEAWLVTIAHRKALDLVRARGRGPEPIGDLPDAPSTHPEPGNDGGDLWRAVAGLPPKQRQAVAYHYLVGLPHAEVAAILGGTADAARRAAADGISGLRRSLAAEWEEARS